MDCTLETVVAFLEFEIMHGTGYAALHLLILLA